MNGKMLNCIALSPHINPPLPLNETTRSPDGFPLSFSSFFTTKIYVLNKQHQRFFKGIAYSLNVHTSKSVT